MTTDNLYDQNDLPQMLQTSNVNYQFNSDKPDITYVDGTRQTFEQAREMSKQSLPHIAFSYKGFWIETETFDQAENGHPENGFTYTSYVYPSKEDRDNLEDYIDSLCESYDNPKKLERNIKKAIDTYIKHERKHS